MSQRGRRPHTQRVQGRKSRHVDVRLVALDLRTFFGGIRLKTQLLVCRWVAHFAIFFVNFAISCKRPDAPLIASSGMNEYAMDAELWGNAAQLDCEPRWRFGPAGRVGVLRRTAGNKRPRPRSCPYQPEAPVLMLRCFLLNSRHGPVLLGETVADLAL